MPSSDLRALREYVANVLDYSPTNPTYARQIDRLLNEADRAITTSKPFTFVNKAAEVTAYADVNIDVSVLTGNIQIAQLPGQPNFLAWMVNQEVKIDGVTYTIVEVVSTTLANLDRGVEAANGSYTVTVINRYLDLPADCSSVLGIARRTDARTPNNPGMLTPLARYEDEWSNLPLGEVNLPVYWLYHDPAYIDGPRKNYTLSTAATVGAGVRTIEITSTLIRGGRESSYGEVQALELTDSQDLVLTPTANPSGTGLLKRYYFRCPNLGYDAWRLLADPNNPGSNMELAASDAAARTFTSLTQNNLENSESFYRYERLQHPDGFVQRVRLYPRQDQDYVFTIRYMQRHQPMVEDGDVSSIPPDQRMLLAYWALVDVLMKHDNPTQSEMYRRRVEEMLLRLERRYLVTTSRRIVKGNWLVNMEPNSFSRFSTLVHT